MNKTKEILPEKKKSNNNISIFGNMNYEEQIARATHLAKTTSEIIKKRNLFTKIQGKEYVHCEGWTTMGAMLGLFPHIIKTEEIAPGRFTAYCEIKTLKGDIITSAESEASIAEKGKNGPKWRDSYAVRSMAQTRAVSKAFRICLSWVMILAGYEPTPMEEIEPEYIYNNQPLTDEEKKQLENDVNKACKKLKWNMKKLAEFISYQIAGKSNWKELTDDDKKFIHKSILLHANPNDPENTSKTTTYQKIRKDVVTMYKKINNPSDEIKISISQLDVLSDVEVCGLHVKIQKILKKQEKENNK